MLESEESDDMDISGTVTSPPPLGVGISGLRYHACGNITTNLSGLGAFCSNVNESTNGYGLDPLPEQQSLVLIQRVVSIVVPILFGIIVFVGLIGNALVSKRTSCNLILADVISPQHTGLCVKITSFCHVAPCCIVDMY